MTTDIAIRRKNSDASENSGFLSGIAGKAFALASVAALVIPLVGMGQLFGMPGAIDSISYQDIPGLIETFNRPAITQQIQNHDSRVQLVGEFHEILNEPALIGRPYTPPDKLLDTHISFIEGAGGLATAAIAGAIGSAFADVSQRHKGTNGAVFTAGAEMASSFAKSTSLARTFMMVDMMDSKPSAMTKGAGAAFGIILASAAVSIPTFLAGKSVYDNFIRAENPYTITVKPA